MQIPKELTTVTPLSKGLALALFILIPFITFLMGQNSGFQTSKEMLTVIFQNSPTVDNGVRYSEVVTVPDLGKRKVYIRRVSEGEALFVSDSNENHIPTKVGPTVVSFWTPVYIVNNFGVVQYGGGDSSAMMIFRLDGTVITENLQKDNPSLKEWTLNFGPGNDKPDIDTFKLYLTKNSGQTSSVLINVRTGKVMSPSNK